MRSFRLLGALAFAGVLFVSSQAHAQKALFDWTGFYGGGSASYTSTTGSYENAGTPHQKMNGAMIGGFFGYRYELPSRVVFGGEVGYDFGSVRTGNINDGNYIDEEGKLSGLAMARAILGYDMGGWMPYIAGGMAWGNISQRESCPQSAAVPFGYCHIHGGPDGFDRTQSKWQSAWTIGAGVEAKLGNGWSLRGEYDYIDFKKTTYNLGSDGIGTPIPSSTMKSHGDNMFKVSLVCQLPCRFK